VTKRRGLAIVAVVLSVAAIVFAFIPPSDARFREYVTQLRAAGRPTSEAELLGPEPDPQDNAADAVMEANAVQSAAHAANVGPRRGDADPNWSWLGSATADEVREVGVFLDGVDPFFDRLDAASRRGHLQVPLSGELIVSDPLVSALQTTNALFYARAIAGTTAEKRLRSIETKMRLSSLCRGVMIQRMVGAAMRTSAVGDLRRAFERGDIDAAGGRGRFDLLLAEPLLPTFRDTAHTELAAQVRMFEALLDGATFKGDDGTMGYQPGHNLVGRTVLGIWGNRGTTVGSPADWVNACRFLEELATLSPDSYPTLRRAIVSRIDALPEFAAARAIAIPFPKIAEMLARADAVTRLARIALAAAEHRATHGDFPASLTDLKWAFPDGVPLDPFTDAPFVYARTATGVRVSSAGRLAEEAPLDDATLRTRCLVWELKR
jgi:hypothetical protein